MIVERTVCAEIFEAQVVRRLTILRAASEEQSAVLQAEGEREAAFCKANARVPTRLLESIAEDDANVTKGNKARTYENASARLGSAANHETADPRTGCDAGCLVRPVGV